MFPLSSKCFFPLILCTVVVVPAVLGICSTPKCEYRCGLSIGSDGCAKCDCAKRPTDSSCPSICPADCGQFHLSNGCLKCDCSIGPWYQVPLQASKISCPQVCPQDCGQERLPNGCLECDCNVGPWFNHLPPPPPPKKSADCILECPQDCGQKEKSDGCLECLCGELWFNPYEYL